MPNLPANVQPLDLSMLIATPPPTDALGIGHLIAPPDEIAKRSATVSENGRGGEAGVVLP